jgi:hypothetical protein
VLLLLAPPIVPFHAILRLSGESQMKSIRKHQRKPVQRVFGVHDIAVE